MIETTTTEKVREHYAAAALTDLIKSALATLAPEDQTLTVAQLAPLDQFHIRGMLATEELAAAARLEPSSRVLDLGCGRRHLRLRGVRSRPTSATTASA